MAIHWYFVLNCNCSYFSYHTGKVPSQVRYFFFFLQGPSIFLSLSGLITRFRRFTSKRYYIIFSIFIQSVYPYCFHISRSISIAILTHKAMFTNWCSNVLLFSTSNVISFFQNVISFFQNLLSLIHAFVSNPELVIKHLYTLLFQLLIFIECLL